MQGEGHSCPLGSPRLCHQAQVTPFVCKHGLTCFGGLWLMFCKRHRSQGWQQPQDYWTWTEMMGQ